MPEFDISSGQGSITLNWNFSQQPPNQTPTFSNILFLEDFITNPLAVDHSAEIQAALNAAKDQGKLVVMFKGNYNVLNNITVPERCSLVGFSLSAGQIGHLGNGSGDYDGRQAVLKVAPTASVYLSHSSSLHNCTLIKAGLDLPFTSASSASAGLQSFAGTAVSIVGGNDANVSNVLLIGFNLGIRCNNSARMRLVDVQGDCNNGILIEQCFDVPYLERCHFWPFTTANYSWTASDTSQAILTRPGIAVELKNTVDWAKLDKCFSYGYFRGIRLGDVGATLVTACMADGPVSSSAPVVAGSIGILVEGDCFDTKITDFTAAGKSQGMFVGTNPGFFTEIIGSNTVACTIGTNIRNGDVVIIGGLDRVASIGLQVQSATSKVAIQRKMKQVTTPVNAVNPANVVITGALAW